MPTSYAQASMNRPQGNEEADFTRLMRAHQDGIWRYLRVLGCSSAEADDLSQDTFLAAFTHPFEERSEPETAGFLRRVARNRFISLRRSQARAPKTHELDQIDAVWIERAESDGGAAYMAALAECLSFLSERERMALDLRHVQRASRKRIALVLELTEDGARNLMQRAKARLRECLERKGADAEQ